MIHGPVLVQDLVFGDPRSITTALYCWSFFFIQTSNLWEASETRVCSDKSIHLNECIKWIRIVSGVYTHLSISTFNLRICVNISLRSEVHQSNLQGRLECWG